MGGVERKYVLNSRRQPEWRHIVILIGVSALLLFGCSSIRHALFQSGAFDLGYFDQAIYLISRGQTPIVSFWGYHVLGGHADWIVYLLAVLYRIVPDIHWLFGIQAIALAIAALPVWILARDAGLKEPQATTIASVYLLYPLVFNLNLFDFHPEVIALPLILTAILAARRHQVIWFTVCIILTVGCRDALSLTVAAMGVWLFQFEQRRVCGAIALVVGVTWFFVATQVIIPAFRPEGVEATVRYAYLGDSVFDIAKNLVLRPQIVLGRIFSPATAEYLLLLLVPLLWGIHWRYLAPMLAALPMLLVNILSESPSQRNLVHQYSLPILPFLMVVVIAVWAANTTWIRSQRAILLWSLLAFLVLGKYTHFGSIYLDSLDNWAATRTALSQVRSEGSVLTTHNLVPHLTHRALIRFTLANSPPDLAQFDYVLLDVRHPGWQSTTSFAASLVQQLQSDRRFDQRYQHDGVYLFTRS